MTLFQRCVPCLSQNCRHLSSSNSHSQLLAPIHNRNHSNLLLCPVRCLLQKLARCYYHYCVPDPGHGLPEQHAAADQTSCSASPSPIKPCAPLATTDAADFRRLIDHFPVLYSFAEDLLNIFGNLEDDDVSSGCNKMSSAPPLRELPFGFMSEGRSFTFGRQN